VPAVVPVIDLAAPGAVREVRRACEEIGFLTVVNHGVPEELVARMEHVSRAFFDLPAAEKTALAGGGTPGLPAYRPPRSETLAASSGLRTPPDLKESLDWGPAVPGSGWPDRPPELHATFLEYFDALGELGGRLRRLFALALGLHEDWFEPAFDSHASSIRAINYPELAAEAEPGQLRAGEHTDYGCMTILRTEDAPGRLQVRTRVGEWVDVEAVPGSFVVNLGDMMARGANDRWVATLHRVSNPPPGPGSRRQTIVFFHDPRADAVIEPIVRDGEAPRYGPITALEHVRAKAARAQEVSTAGSGASTS
jgi:isopenicillin N synthase-like dioxygenase